MSGLLPVADALAAILEGVTPLEAETVPLDLCLGRVLAADVASRRTQPPWDTSAMDGYAARAADLAGLPAELRIVGESRAGERFGGEVGPGEAARIFTGAPLPTGADTIVIQEDADRRGDTVTVREAGRPGRFVRRRGLDFREGEVLLEAGRVLAPADIAIAAAMNHPELPVRRRPRVALLSTGDELVAPGGDPGPDQIIASNAYGVGAMMRRAGADPIDLGIVADKPEATSAAFDRASEESPEVLVTLGGASVGEHDLVHAGLEAKGAKLGFWKIAMRPGKPLMFGRLGPMRVLGLPGNPVSSMVCAQLFVVPLVKALLGLPPDTQEEEAILGGDLGENDKRQDYMRATLKKTPQGLVATPHGRQDSSMLATLHRSQCLLVRPPFAPAAKAGDPCRIVRLDV
ncbi:gephyrin-like molybdotransferase Glp [Lutibaculum baratangense]|uniref:Molybdopterin molybdenumtransferase n=1 Tax=Lutibaculum baratangense AMV1 TaxID=631454 RepID=V4RBH0_9HYPH|nr:gephyrin-like molybdotransferase Glp [Lutibaculum baratangense]ESR23486.1 Molybdopterin biosynthesis protein MoeA [Lutibaculum baratangense AMV1]